MAKSGQPWALQPSCRSTSAGPASLRTAASSAACRVSGTISNASAGRPPAASSASRIRAWMAWCCGLSWSSPRYTTSAVSARAATSRAEASTIRVGPEGEPARPRAARRRRSRRGRGRPRGAPRHRPRSDAAPGARWPRLARRPRGRHGAVASSRRAARPGGARRARRWPGGRRRSGGCRRPGSGEGRPRRRRAGTASAPTPSAARRPGNTPRNARVYAAP